MEQYTEVNEISAIRLLGIDYDYPKDVLKRLKRGMVSHIDLPSITGHELRIRDGRIILYTHS
jgi:hypothetical protein